MKRKGEGRRREGEKEEERGDEPPLHVLDSLLHYTNNLRQAINRLPPSDCPHVMVLVVPDRLTSWLWWCLTDSPHPDQPEPSLTNLNQNPQTLTQAELAGIELGEYLLSRMKTRIGCQKVRSGGGDETLVTLQKGSCRINVKTLPLAISSS